VPAIAGVPAITVPRVVQGLAGARVGRETDPAATTGTAAERPDAARRAATSGTTERADAGDPSDTAVDG
jgi:hypothetical protein